MARQLDLLGADRIIPTALHTEMQRSYLEYAMSVIIGRALPDVRDGLKPVHRRILYSMYELGLTPDRPFRKCARVVGDVLGKYHPHGDQSVYDALVRLVQDFSSRYPLLSGHGNFGSVDNDPAAAMRYTETRLSAISHEALLGDISESIVDFTPNFDNSQAEPTVLPAQLPVLLLNGCSGIAVGMATNIPPHNLGELIDGLILLIDRPQTTDDELWTIIPGPDFPTGGEIVGNTGIREAYQTGRGIIPLRGVATIEEANNQVKTAKYKKRRNTIIVSELPYQVNKAGWIEKVAELVNAGKIDGIADLRDESDRDGMRVVIELKRDSEPQQVLDNLYRQTSLQTNFGAILLALVDGQPSQLSLRQLLEEFLKFREETLTRQYGQELENASRRVHLVSGLLTALDNLDQLIDILRKSPDGTSAKQELKEKFNLTDAQTDAILAMPMRRLTGMEKSNLQEEFTELNQKISRWELLLSDRHELLKALKKDLRSLKRKYSDNRRTKIIIAQESQQVKEVLKVRKTPPIAEKVEQKNTKKKIQEPAQMTIVEPINPVPVTLEVNHLGEISRDRHNNHQSSKLIIKKLNFQSDQELTFITSTGKAYPVKANNIPISSHQPIKSINLIPSLQGTQEIIINYFTPDDLANFQQFILLTKEGKIKRLLVEEINNLTNRGLSLIKLKEDDKLQYMMPIDQANEIILGTSSGRLIRLHISDNQIPVLGRNSQGIPAIKLGAKEHLVCCNPVRSIDELILVSHQGYTKKLPVMALRLVQIGSLGNTVMQFTSKTDMLLGAIVAPLDGKLYLFTNHDNTHQLPNNTIKIDGKDGPGEKLIKLSPDEQIIALHQE